jgi:hypothetical protein
MHQKIANIQSRSDYPDLQTDGDSGETTGGLRVDWIPWHDSSNIGRFSRTASRVVIDFERGSRAYIRAIRLLELHRDFEGYSLGKENIVDMKTRLKM